MYNIYAITHLFIQFLYFAGGGYVRDILVQQAVVDTSDSYQTCGSIEGVFVGFQRVNCYKPMSTRFVKITSTYHRIDMHEIEVIGHWTHHSSCYGLFGCSSGLINYISLLTSVQRCDNSAFLDSRLNSASDKVFGLNLDSSKLDSWLNWQVTSLEIFKLIILNELRLCCNCCSWAMWG